MYPRNVGPQSQAQEMAWLYGSLAAAWSLVAQYQEIEADAEQERMRRRREDVIKSKLFDKPSEGVSEPDEGPATSGGQSC
jgi:hypothetical protein